MHLSVPGPPQSTLSWQSSEPEAWETKQPGWGTVPLGPKGLKIQREGTVLAPRVDTTL